MFKSTSLAKMFAGRKKFFRGPHVRHLCDRRIKMKKSINQNVDFCCEGRKFKWVRGLIDSVR